MFFYNIVNSFVRKNVYLLTTYKTHVGNFFADVIMLFLNIRWYLPGKLLYADVN